MKINAKNPRMKTKIEKSQWFKKPVFVTLLKTEELLVLLTKRYPLKPIFRVISIFAVLNNWVYFGL